MKKIFSYTFFPRNSHLKSNFAYCISMLRLKQKMHLLMACINTFDMGIRMV